MPLQNVYLAEDEGVPERMGDSTCLVEISFLNLQGFSEQCTYKELSGLDVASQ